MTWVAALVTSVLGGLFAHDGKLWRELAKKIKAFLKKMALRKAASIKADVHVKKSEKRVSKFLSDLDSDDYDANELYEDSLSVKQRGPKANPNTDEKKV